MRRSAVLILTLLTGLSSLASALDRQGMGTIGGSIGAMSLLGSAPSLSSDARTRMSFRAHTKYVLSNKLRVTGSAGYAWNSFKGAYDATTKETLDTLLIITPIEVGLEYSFGADFAPSRPYVGAQLGVYRWEIVANQPFGVRNIVRDNAASTDLDKAFFGIGANLGEEYFWSDNASFSVELGVHHINVSADRFSAASFAPRFAKALTMAEARFGMTYYFPVAPGSANRVSTGPAAVDTSAIPKSAAPRPEIQKENIQITPDEPESPTTPKPQTPPAPVPAKTTPDGSPAPAPPAAAPVSPAPAPVSPPAAGTPAADSTKTMIPPPAAAPSDSTATKPH